MRGSTFFNVMVLGDNPEELMKGYDISLKVEPYIKYEFSKAEQIRKNSISVLEEIIKDPNKFNMNDFHIECLKDKVKHIKGLTKLEYYNSLVKGLKIDDNGDAWTDENPNGKWQTFKLGDSYAMPLIVGDNVETSQARMKDIKWDRIHKIDVPFYELVWDLVHGIQKPLNDTERNIYNNMKDNKEYFSKFKNKEEYVTYCSSYWNYAILDENGWKDIDDSKNPNEWVTSFYDKFIKPLNPNTLITIYECTKNKTE